MLDLTKLVAEIFGKFDFVLNFIFIFHQIFWILLFIKAEFPQRTVNIGAFYQELTCIFNSHDEKSSSMHELTASVLTHLPWTFTGKGCRLYWIWNHIFLLRRNSNSFLIFLMVWFLLNISNQIFFWSILGMVVQGFLPVPGIKAGSFK